MTEIYREMTKGSSQAPAQCWTMMKEWRARHSWQLEFFEHGVPRSILQSDYSPSIIHEHALNAYCEFLDILDAKGCLDKELAMGGRDNDKFRRMLRKWEREWTVFTKYSFHTEPNAFLKAIEGLSKEGVQILFDLYPEELSHPREIAMRYIVGSHADTYAEAFPEEFFEIFKSEHLLYAIFWRFTPEQVLDFIRKALEYDGDYFRNYRDEVGNTCLHFYLMRFELLPGSQKPAKTVEEIKELLIAGGVSPETPNDGGVSYRELHRYTEMYADFTDLKYACNRCRYVFYDNGWIEWLQTVLSLGEFEGASYVEGKIYAMMALVLGIKF